MHNHAEKSDTAAPGASPATAERRGNNTVPSQAHLHTHHHHHHFRGVSHNPSPFPPPI